MKKLSKLLTVTGLALLMTACTPFTKVQGDSSTLSKINGDWRVMYLAGKPLEGLPRYPEIHFDTASNTITGFDGCNPIKGTFLFDGGRLKAKTASGRLACASDTARQVSAAMQDLFTNGAEVIETSLFKGHVLMIRNASSEIRLGPVAAFAGQAKGN